MTHTVVVLCLLFWPPVLNYDFFLFLLDGTLRFYLYCVVVNGSLTFLFRLASSDRVPPFLHIYLHLHLYFSVHTFTRFRSSNIVTSVMVKSRIWSLILG